VTPLPARRAQPLRFADRTASHAGTRNWRAVGALAAAAAVVVTAIGVWRSRQGADVAAASALAPATYTTAVGQRDSLRLADGTTVMLGPSSRLDVAAGYGSAAREVALRGEAYFAVRHDASHPFTVHAGNAKIVDVGTAFTVREDSGAGVRVAVTAGSVRVSRASTADSGSDTGVVLAAGDAATLADAASPTVARGSVTGDDTAFTHGALVLRDAPLAQVAAELRRWYGLELRVSDSAVARRRLTATFAGESPDEAIAIIGAALGARIERRGDTVIVR
jgi:transmembrane sensor